jgi:hypothetical protein
MVIVPRMAAHIQIFRGCYLPPSERNIKKKNKKKTQNQKLNETKKRKRKKKEKERNLKPQKAHPARRPEVGYENRVRFYYYGKELLYLSLSRTSDLFQGAQISQFNQNGCGNSFPLSHGSLPCWAMFENVELLYILWCGRESLLPKTREGNLRPTARTRARG